MFEELRKSFGENLRERLTSPFYGSFVISWCLWNWKVWYVTVFVDSGLLFQKENILKVDYIVGQYQWNLGWHFVWSISHLIVLPLISAYVAVFWLSKVTHWFYKKSLDTEKMNELAKEKKEGELLEAKRKRLTTAGDVLKIEGDVLKKEQEVQNIKSENLQEEWDDEYEKFKRNSLFRSFSSIKDVIYKREGRTNDFLGNILNTSVKAFADSHDLIKMNIGNGGERVSLTEKGKYFMKRYIEDSENSLRN